MAHETSTGPSTRSRPIEEVRLGMVKAAIWKNETEAGPRYNVTFERVFRDGEEWKSTTSFGRDDLLLLAKVADQAHTWILTTARNSTATSAGTGGPTAGGEPLREASLPRRRRQAAEG